MAILLPCWEGGEISRGVATPAIVASCHTDTKILSPAVKYASVVNVTRVGTFAVGAGDLVSDAKTRGVNELTGILLIHISRVPVLFGAQVKYADNE